MIFLRRFFFSFKQTWSQSGRNRIVHLRSNFRWRFFFLNLIFNTQQFNLYGNENSFQLSFEVLKNPKKAWNVYIQDINTTSLCGAYCQWNAIIFEKKFKYFLPLRYNFTKKKSLNRKNVELEKCFISINFIVPINSEKKERLWRKYGNSLLWIESLKFKFSFELLHVNFSHFFGG